jgi:3-phosphoshikimate 1-carboxyvinyltransferase
MFGAEFETDGPAVRLRGEVELRPQRLAIPGDLSAAAFLAVAALVVPGSEVRIDRVCANPRRTGLFRILRDMGADLAFENVRERSGEPVADLVVRHSALTAVDVSPESVADMIDEFPILFVAAAFADGTTHARGLAELRFKESDRIAAMAEGLSALGVVLEESEDGLAVRGTGGEMLTGGQSVAARADHRIAMAFAVAGLHSRQPVGIDDMACAATSFPGFEAALGALAPA